MTKSDYIRHDLKKKGRIHLSFFLIIVLVRFVLFHKSTVSCLLPESAMKSFESKNERNVRYLVFLLLRSSANSANLAIFIVINVW